MKLLKPIGYILLLTVLSLTIAEVTCRIAGLTPYINQTPNRTFKPALPGKIDSVLGYSWVPGHFVITIGDTFSFSVNHNIQGRRYSAPDNLNYADSTRSKMVVLGCSFTDGECLEDSCTHPFILQQLCDKNNQTIRVENWGVGGYGLTQFYLQAKEIVKDTAVKYVVLNYSSFQDDRTECSRSRRKSTIPNSRQKSFAHLVNFPFFTVAHKELKLQYRTLEYCFLPLQKYSAFIELLDNLYCKWEIRNSTQITKLVLKQTLDMLKKNNKQVFLSGITGDNETIKVVTEFKNKGYRTILYGINTGENKYNLYPIDGHPNYVANKIFAATIYNSVFEK